MSAQDPRPVIPEKYARALAGDDPVKVMAASAARLRKLVGGLTERQAAQPPLPGKWSIKEIVAHLADGEIILGSRYRFAAAHDRPPLPGYDQDAFAARLGPLNARLADLLDAFEGARRANLLLLRRLPKEAWDRVGLHAERGEESIRTMVQMYAGHDRHHMAQIATIRAGLFPAKARKRKSSARKGSRRR